MYDLPEHLWMGVNADGEGPMDTAEEVHHWVCWCGTPGCNLPEKEKPRMTNKHAAVKAIVAELERLAGIAESHALWTENNFLPGPNSDYSIRHERETAEWLLREADDWKNGYYTKSVEGLDDE